MSEVICDLTSMEEYQQGIAPLRLRDPSGWMDQPLLPNAMGDIQYYGQEYFDRIIYLPLVAKIGNTPVAYTSMYNISDTVIRFGGIYVLPKYRSQGIGRTLCDYGLSLWPEPWRRLVGYYRNETFLRFSGGWGLREFPAHYWRIETMKNGDVRVKTILAYKDFR